MVRENDAISDNDLYHVFKKVDIDNNQEITSTVSSLTNIADNIAANLIPGTSSGL